jgi:hypothetical protein
MSVEVSIGEEPIPRHIQDFVFVRELSEVYLLLDHVSGRSDKSLIDGSVVREICEIGWPPTGTEIQQAAQAAVLLNAKDKLNAAARPASGATIAFTLLVSGEDNVEHHHHRHRDWGLSSLWPRALARSRGTLDPDGGSAGSSDGGGGTPQSPAAARRWTRDPPSRLSLARLAFPGLVSPARWFKWEIRFIILLLLLWLMGTCVLSWDVAAGKAIYARVENLRAQSSQFEAQIKALETGASGPNPAAPTDKTKAIALLLEKNCGWQSLVDRTGQQAHDSTETFSSVDEISLCNRLARARLEYAVSRQDLAGWLADWRYWLSGLANRLCSRNCLPKDESSLPLPKDQTNEQWGSILLEVLAGAVLPLCYGFLGAGAAVVRDLWGKMRDSLLSPRDLTLALGQLALGAVIGGCIGLFISPPGSSADGAGGLMGSVVLSASALSFIAGFGVEGVFVALESLIKRVFNITEPTKAT